jgi:hypothetical protein
MIKIAFHSIRFGLVMLLTLEFVVPFLCGKSLRTQCERLKELNSIGLYLTLAALFGVYIIICNWLSRHHGMSRWHK